jgi:transcriptional regulator with XRE-family HTH domain
MKQSFRRYRATNVIPTLRDQGRTVSWLARRVGLSRQYTSDIVHGHVDAHGPLAERISEALGVPLFLLFAVSDGIEIDPKRMKEVVA